MRMIKRNADQAEAERGKVVITGHRRLNIPYAIPNPPKNPIEYSITFHQLIAICIPCPIVCKKFPKPKPNPAPSIVVIAVKKALSNWFLFRYQARAKAAPKQAAHNSDLGGVINHSS